MKTITFYSYKGGTGRTLLLANLARYIARANKRVAIIDFDLEAPGLHYKFGIDLESQDQGTSSGHTAPPKRGAIDLLLAWQEELPIAPLQEYLRDISPPSAPAKSCFLIAAGLPLSSEYVDALGRLSWERLDEEKFSGGIVDLKNKLSAQFAIDYLLIDSRTGFSNVSALALFDVKVTDQAVCLFSNNIENISGIGLVMASIFSHFADNDKGKIVPVLTRLPHDDSVSNETVDNVCNDLNKAIRKAFEKFGVDEPLCSFARDEIVTIRSSRELEKQEEIIVGSDATLRNSLVLLDYMRVFDKIDSFDENIILFPKLSRLYATSFFDNNTNTNAVSFGSRIDKVKKHGIKSVSLGYEPDENYKMAILHILTNICNLIGINQQVKTILEEILPTPDMAAFRFAEGSIDFCCDPYYLNHSRRPIVDVLPLGRIENYGVMVIQNGKTVSTKIQSSILEDALKLSDAVFGNSQCDILLVSETAATSEALPRLLYFSNPDRVKLAQNRDYLNILIKERKSCIIIADLDVLQKINNPAAYCSIKFQTEIPVGLMYSPGDYEWRRYLSEAVLDYLKDDPVTKWHGLSHSLQSAGIIPLTGEELLRELLLDFPQTEALERLQSLGSLGNIMGQ